MTVVTQLPLATMLGKLLAVHHNTELTPGFVSQDVLQKTAAAAGPLLSKAKDGVAAAFSRFKPAAQSEPPKVEL